MKLRLGTRGSDLAMHQATMVKDALEAVHGTGPDADGIEVELVEVTTKGDLDKRRLDVIAGRGIFVRELDLQVADGTLDGAVHSLKDVPTELIEGVELAAHLPRGPRGDALVSGHVGEDADADDPMADLPDGARVGTSSPRRKAQLLRARADLEVVDLRGNVGTRVRKALTELDGAVLAQAGLARLGDERLREAGLAHGYARLAEEDFPPAPGQGIVCATARPGTEAFERLAAVDDPAAATASAVERTVIATLGVGCHTPLATLTDVDIDAGAGGGADEVRLLAELVALDGSETVRVEDRFARDRAADGARGLAERLKDEAAHLL